MRTKKLLIFKLMYHKYRLLVFTGLILSSVGLIFSCAEKKSEQASTVKNENWQADPAVVKEREQVKPGFIWEEDSVPSYQLPDVLKAADGTTVTSPETWQERRREILEQFRKFMFGRRPDKPEHLSFEIVREDGSAMNGTATLRRVTIRSTQQGRSHEFELILFLPNKVQKPVPVFLLLNNRDPINTDPTRQEKSDFWPAEEVIERGYGIAAIQNDDLAPDDKEGYEEGVIRLFEGESAKSEREPDTWGALAAWGWGASRVMDYFETDSRVDKSKVAVLGHSRGGKAALWAGAEDERFALIISNDSGCGGAALSRRCFGERVRDVNRFTHWYDRNFKTFNDKEDELPFDQHMLIALMAPRAVYVASADEDLWADPKGEFLSLAHASPVYALWGEPLISPDDMPALSQPLVTGRQGYHIRPEGHDLTLVDWRYYMDFADRLWQPLANTTGR